MCRVECEGVCRSTSICIIYASIFSEFACEMVASFPASFPGSCVGGEKRAWYTLFVHTQYSQDFWEFGNSRKICFVTLTSAKHADFSHIKDACH